MCTQSPAAKMSGRLVRIASSTDDGVLHAEVCAGVGGEFGVGRTPTTTSTKSTVRETGWPPWLAVTVSAPVSVRVMAVTAVSREDVDAVAFEFGVY